MSSAQIPYDASRKWCAHRTGREEETVDSNGKRLWKKSSTYGKPIRIIWNNLGQLLVLKMPRQWRIMARLGGEGLRRHAAHFWKHRLSPCSTCNRWEPVIAHRKTHSHLKELEHHCFPPLPSPSWVTFAPTSVAINILWVTFHSKYRLLSNGSRNTKMTSTC